MQLTSAPAGGYDRVATQRQLNDLAIDLSRHDQQLESMVRNGSTVGDGWGDWFDRTSHELMRTRDAYVALNPQDRELAARFGAEVLDFSSNGGRIASAEERNSTLANGWRSALDGTISIVQEAANRLYSTPGGPGYPGGPGLPTGGATDAARAAIHHVRSMVDTIRSLPVDDRGSDRTKSARLAANDASLAAQRLIEPYMDGTDWTSQRLRAADQMLEDANWQLTRESSPDGRFNGVDLRGALRDAQGALAELGEAAGIGG